jgi:ERCC4-type nuclease
MWMKDKPENEAKEYCSSLMKKRIEKKGIEYAPTQVELRTIMSPPIQYHDKLFGSYNEFCEDLGLKTKFISPNQIIENEKWKGDEYKIYVDTREQKPLKFKNRQVEIKTLKFGDYAFSDKEATCNCYIERKNLSDFIGTISGGHERFVNEIERAREANAYLVVLVEDTLTNSLSFPFLRHISKKIKATPEFIFNRVRSLTQNYPHLQFLFVKGRIESSRVIEKIFTSGCVHEKIDLQLAYDTKKL